MPRFNLNIHYSPEKMELSRRRMEARGAFRYVDRVPILYGVFPRYFAPLFNLRYINFFKDAETEYYWQLQFAKYRIENMPEDYCIGPTIYVHPYFDNVIPPSGHGGTVGWLDDGPPRAIPVIKTVEQMERFEVNPMLMKDGSYHEVKQAAWECLEEMGPCGGLLLGDGANVCPGTPLASFQAIAEASEEFGLGDGKLPGSIWSGTA